TWIPAFAGMTVETCNRLHFVSAFYGVAYSAGWGAGDSKARVGLARIALKAGDGAEVKLLAVFPVPPSLATQSIDRDSKISWKIMPRKGEFFMPSLRHWFL